MNYSVHEVKRLSSDLFRQLIPRFSVSIPMLGCLFLSYFSLFGQNAPYAFNGVLDARTWDFKNKKLPLNGYWNFSYNQLLPPGECAKAKNSRTIYFPKFWNDTYTTGEGFATYCLKILTPPETDTFGIALPQLYCSYELWVNKKKIASNGAVGKTKEETIPQWLPQVVLFSTPDDTLFVTLQLANFHHHNGGIREPVYLGSPEQIRHHRSVALVSNHVNTIFFTLTGLILIFLYFRKNKATVIFYFAMLCLVMSVRSMFSNLYTFIHFFPEFDWTWMVRIEYLSLYLINIFAVLFLTHLFGNLTHQGVKYFLITANSLFIIITLLFSPMFFTRWLPVYLIFSVITLLYGTVSITRAILQEQRGAWLLVTSLLMSVFTFSYDLVSYEWSFAYNPLILNIGYILIFLSTGLAILLHAGVIKSSKPRRDDMLRYSDLFGENREE